MFIYRYKIKFDCCGYLGSVVRGVVDIDSTSKDKAIETAKKRIELENLIFIKNGSFEVVSVEGVL